MVPGSPLGDICEGWGKQACAEEKLKFSVVATEALSSWSYWSAWSVFLAFFFFFLCMVYNSLLCMSRLAPELRCVHCDSPTGVCNKFYPASSPSISPTNTTGLLHPMTQTAVILVLESQMTAESFPSQCFVQSWPPSALLDRRVRAASHVWINVLPSEPKEDSKHSASFSVVDEAMPEALCWHLFRLQIDICQAFTVQQPLIPATFKLSTREITDSLVFEMHASGGVDVISGTRVQDVTLD